MLFCYRVDAPMHYSHSIIISLYNLNADHKKKHLPYSVPLEQQNSHQAPSQRERF